MERTCLSCGKPFLPRRSHFWLCPSCWKDTVFGASEAIAELLKARMERDYWRERATRLEATPSLPAGFQEQLPRLLQLCHPDRHENSTMSNEATQWLLRARDKLRAG